MTQEQAVLMGGPEILVSLLGLATLAGLGRMLFRRRRRARILELTERVTRGHARVLLVRQKQLVVHDGYGNHDLQAWIQHANYFIDHVILREAAQAGLDIARMSGGKRLRAAVTKRFLDVLNAHVDEGGEEVEAADILSGRHYETLCCNILQSHGWIVGMTPASGDQGADLVADREGKRVVIQCKFYSKPVGNKAVQEVFAAREFHAGDFAAVVSNNSFTRSARELAQVNGVLLLHQDELPQLGRLTAELPRRRARGRGPE